MSDANKTRLEVQAILRGNILESFQFFELSNWDCMEFANPSLQNRDGVVLMNYLKSDRTGWQGFDMDILDDTLRTKEDWQEVQHWQLHVIKRRDDTTQDSSILSEDVAGYLVAWFNGRGCEYFRNNGMSNLVIDANNIIVYNDNSNLYQKRAVFTVKIVVPKEITSPENELTLIQPDIKPV